jgi:hypothetical protein
MRFPIQEELGGTGSGKTVVEQQYHVQGKADKGLLRLCVAKMTGLSRAQVTRLIGQYLSTGKIEERGYRRHRFPSLYTRETSSCWPQWMKLMRPSAYVTQRV